jgi:uncharacterized membrane protein YedE/YeeE
MIVGRDAMLVLLAAVAIVVLQLIDIARGGKEPTGLEHMKTGWPALAIGGLIAYVYFFWQ